MSDSLSNLISIYHLNTSQPVISQIINELNERKNIISLAWIPGHVGIIGNEEADLKAKETIISSSFEVCPLISDQDFQNSTKFKSMDEWQNIWTNCNNNKLREIKQSVLPWPKPFIMSRRDEVILVRLRIGHTHMTHGYLMAKEDPPACPTCGTLMSVKHILLECHQVNETRIQQELPGPYMRYLHPLQRRQINLSTS
ncbi:unnamed protein product [Macrosiphum euphorbiae]|uniref:RNase H type-1 domain-containing protein n=1 Tax=Macrosiphum euphorbiae TaxID=13131 RepID=A0AAV0Y7F0_9HEMI|nr:unnamed protein product [Macrosiphum euphorbiae]